MKEEALIVINDALKKFPKHYFLIANKGKILSDMNRLPEAIKCFDKLLEIDPQFGVAYSFKGNLMYRYGRKMEALKLYEEALKLNPNDPYAREGKKKIIEEFSVVQNVELIEKQ